MKNLFVLTLLFSSFCSASTISLLSGQTIPMGENIVYCSQSLSLSKPCVIDLNRYMVFTAGGSWLGSVTGGSVEDLIEIAKRFEKNGTCYGITIK